MSARPCPRCLELARGMRETAGRAERELDTACADDQVSARDLQDVLAQNLGRCRGALMAYAESLEAHAREHAAPTARPE